MFSVFTILTGELPRVHQPTPPLFKSCGADSSATLVGASLSRQETIGATDHPLFQQLSTYVIRCCFTKCSNEKCYPHCSIVIATIWEIVGERDNWIWIHQNMHHQMMTVVSYNFQRIQGAYSEVHQQMPTLYQMAHCKANPFQTWKKTFHYQPENIPLMIQKSQTANHLGYS